MRRRRRTYARTSATPAELLEDRQLLTGLDFGDATLLADQGLIPGTALEDLQVSGEGVDVYPAFSPDQLRYSVTPSAETDGITIAPFANADQQVTVNGRSIDAGDSIVLRDLSEGETVFLNVYDAGDHDAEPRTYEIIYLPIDFPLDVQLNAAADVNTGSIYVTPRPQNGTNYVARIDHNGVPEFVQSFEQPAVQGRGPTVRIADFKQHANGLFSYSDASTRNEFNRYTSEFVILDHNFQEIDRVDAIGNGINHTDFHDFLILENGNYAFLSYNGVERDGVFYEDSVVVVIDPTTKEEVFRWDSWEEIGSNIGTPENEVVDIGEQLGGETRIPEYAHINSLFQDENGDYIMSLRFTSSIIKVDGETSEIIWRLGGLRSDFEIDDPWGGPCGQHTAQINSKGNLIFFDNGTPCPELPEYDARPEDNDRRMRYVEYELDEQNMTATLVREIVHPTYDIGPTGSVQELPNDHVLVSWGLPGTNFSEYSLIEYDANDQPVREYSFDGRDVVHFSYRAWYAEDQNYPTLAADNGASHTIVAGIHLGSGVDEDEDGQPSTTGGDDLNVYDTTGATNVPNDEDGVTFVSTIVPGQRATVEVDASTDGLLSAWIDFNNDGDWTDAGEQIFADTQLSPGTNSLSFAVPADASMTSTFSRFRFSTDAGLAPDGHATDGEVEDHRVDIVSAPAELLADESGRLEDIFGHDVAISGRYAAVAAPHDGTNRKGAVQIYERVGSNWVKVTQITAPDSTNDIKGGDRFGESIALDGGTLIVGAPRDEDGEADRTSGAVYVFERDEGGEDNWGLVQRVRALDASLGDQFGSSVAIHDETLVVGARLDDGLLKKNSGSVYVFKQKSTGDWSQIRHLFDADSGRNDQYGYAVDVYGNNLIVGAPRASLTVETDEGTTVYPRTGRAYIYHSEGDRWDLQRSMDAPDFTNDIGGGDRFGNSVAIDRSLAVVGAHFEERGNSDLNSGAVYVLRKNVEARNTWGIASKLTANDPAIRDQFGYDVDINNGRIAVGARTKRTDDGLLKAGAVFLFDRVENQDNWHQVQKLEADDAAPRDFFGESVAVSGDYTLVGAPLSDDSGTSSGKAYITFTASTDLLVAATSPASIVNDQLTTADLQPVTAAAIEQWRQEPLSSAQRLALDNFSISIGDLPEGQLGQTVGPSVVIDDNAAGFGWYVDSTPSDVNDDTIGNRMDLLTTVAHEIGHVLGLGHSSDRKDIMYHELETGERRTVSGPTHVEQPDLLFASLDIDFDLL